MKKTIRLQYNAPVVLTFALVSLLVLLLNNLTGGWANRTLFSVYRSSLQNPFTYPRFFLHVLGHSNYSHYIGNITMLLIAGPSLEERYGSKNMFWAILVTAFITGLIQWLLFPGIAVCGASGIVFMMMVMLSLSGMKEGCIPLTLILVLVLYVGGEVVNGFVLKDNISQLMHVVGGICGACLGVSMR